MLEINSLYYLKLDCSHFRGVISIKKWTRNNFRTTYKPKTSLKVAPVKVNVHKFIYYKLQIIDL